MKKKIFLGLVILISLFTICGCDNKENNNGGNNNNNNTNNNTVNHKVYKYMKISSSISSNLYYYAEQLFDNPSAVGYGNKEYEPFLIVEFDTNTGNATNVKYYSFFLDYEDNEWVNKAIEKYDEASGKAKDEVKNVKKGRVNDNVSYLTANIDPDSYAFDQYLQYLFKGQDIDDYKDRVYYKRLYNYSTTPEHKEGDNYFEDSLSHIRIEWSDSEIKTF